MSDAAVSMDGRHERRRHNVEAVVDALYDLWCEGELAPSAKAIAARSGVSLRSVFRYFDDLDCLVSTAVERRAADTDHHFELLSAEGLFEERCRLLASRRVAYQTDADALVQAIRIRAPFHPQLAAALSRRVDQLRDQLATLFSIELSRFTAQERTERLAVLEAATGFDAVRQLRETRGFSEDRTVDVLSATVGRLLS